MEVLDDFLIKAADSDTSPLSNITTASPDSTISTDDLARRDSMDALDVVAVPSETGIIPTPDNDPSKDKLRRTKRKQLPTISTDTGVQRCIKKARTEAEVPAFIPPPALDAPQIDRDLEELGFSADRKRDIMEMDKGKLAWDAALPQYYYDEQVNQETAKRKHLEKKGVVVTGGLKYESLFLGADTRWVLYDPNKGWPQHCGRNMPDDLEKIAMFKPTHARILSYNTQSKNVHIRRCPKAWKGKTVEYTAYGPRLMDLPKSERPAAKRENSRMRFTDDSELDEIEGKSAAAVAPSGVSSTETVAAKFEPENNPKTGEKHTKGITIVANVEESMNTAYYSATDPSTLDLEAWR